VKLREKLAGAGVERARVCFNGEQDEKYKRDQIQEKVSVKLTSYHIRNFQGKQAYEAKISYSVSQLLHRGGKYSQNKGKQD